MSSILSILRSFFWASLMLLASIILSYGSGVSSLQAQEPESCSMLPFPESATSRAPFVFECTDIDQPFTLTLPTDFGSVYLQNNTGIEQRVVTICSNGNGPDITFPEPQLSGGTQWRIEAGGGMMNEFCELNPSDDKCCNYIITYTPDCPVGNQQAEFSAGGFQVTLHVNVIDSQALPEQSQSQLISLGTTYLGPNIDKFFLESHSFVSTQSTQFLWIGGACRNMMMLELDESNPDLPIIDAMEPEVPQTLTSAGRLNKFCAIGNDRFIEYLPYGDIWLRSLSTASGDTPGEILDRSEHQGQSCRRSLSDANIILWRGCQEWPNEFSGFLAKFNNPEADHDITYFCSQPNKQPYDETVAKTICSQLGLKNGEFISIPEGVLCPSQGNIVLVTPPGIINPDGNETTFSQYDINICDGRTCSMNELIAVQCESDSQSDLSFSSVNHACQNQQSEYISVVTCGTHVRRFKITSNRIEQIGQDIPIAGGDHYEGVAAAFPDNETLIFATRFRIGLFKYEVRLAFPDVEEFVLKDEVFIPKGRPILAIDPDESVYSMMDTTPPVLLHFYFNNTDFTNFTTHEGLIQSGSTHIAVSNNRLILALNKDTGQLQQLKEMSNAEMYSQDDLITCPESFTGTVVAAVTSTAVIVVSVLIPAAATVACIVRYFYRKRSMDFDQSDTDDSKPLHRRFPKQPKQKGASDIALDEIRPGRCQGQALPVRAPGSAEQGVRERVTISEEERANVFAGGATSQDDSVPSEVIVHTEEVAGTAGTESSTESPQAPQQQAIEGVSETPEKPESTNKFWQTLQYWTGTSD
ncbi:MAG: hypothetical protein ACR2PT_14140 [Endozoicomonas sp.]